MRKFLYALPLLAAVPLVAQMPMPKEAPGKADVKRVTGGNYVVGTDHTLVSWSVNHMGFSDYFGLFGGATGTLKLDTAKPNNSSVSIEIPMSGLATTNAKLNQHLSGADFLDVAKFGTAKFVSTMIMANGNSAMIHGNLTLHGITKPIVLNAKFAGAGINPFGKKETVGFHATGSIKRSEFGIAGFIPMVADTVDLKIAAEFQKAG